jgi:hypothetical protein
VTALLKLRGLHQFPEFFSICILQQNRIEILISGNWTFFFLVVVESNPRVQLEKCIFWPRNRPRTAISRRFEKAIHPSQFSLAGRQVADGRLNCQNQLFDSLSEMISLLDHEWARPETSDLFRWSRDSKCRSPVKNYTPQIRNLAVLIFLFVSDRSFQLYFCRYDFHSETISVSIYSSWSLRYSGRK